jgi:transposase
MPAGRLGNVITHCRHRITNAVAEGLTGKIMAIKRRAGGYRNPANFTTVIYFYCGGLRLHPSRSRMDPVYLFACLAVG